LDVSVAVVKAEPLCILCPSQELGGGGGARFVSQPANSVVPPTAAAGSQLINLKVI
jgi:hypothetical protein